MSKYSISPEYNVYSHFAPPISKFYVLPAQVNDMKRFFGKPEA